MLPHEHTTTDDDGADHPLGTLLQRMGAAKLRKETAGHGGETMTKTRRSVTLTAQSVAESCVRGP